MRRVLMPYEIQICKELNLSTEEYCAYLAYRNEIAREKLAKPQPDEIRCGPFLVPVIIAVVGAVLQITAQLLLAPKQDKNAGNVQEKFSPTYGFNSLQELAQYGQPVFLVYGDRDTNPTGGVRVNTQMVWSEVLALGGSQFGRFLGVVGSGEIVEIDTDWSAIGDTPLSETPNNRVWAYKRLGIGPDERPRNSDNVLSSNDPSYMGTNSGLVYLLRDNTGVRVGYSQAYQPRTNASIGCYSFVPINIEIEVDSSTGGSGDNAMVGITSTPQWTSRQAIAAGDTFQITLNSTNPDDYNENDDGDAGAANIRRSAADSLDFGAQYKMGTAKFVLQSLDPPGRMSTDEGSMIATFKCTESGSLHSTSYTQTTTEANRTKGLVKFEEGKYSTTTPSDIVDFCLKAQVYRQIQGRKKTSQNGYQYRQSFFEASYRLSGAANWTRVPGTFAIRSKKPVDIYTYLKFCFNARNQYEFKFVPVYDVEQFETQTIGGGTTPIAGSILRLEPWDVAQYADHPVGHFYNLSVIGGSGTGAIANVVIAPINLGLFKYFPYPSSWTIINPGSGYQLGDLVYVQLPTKRLYFAITNVQGATTVNAIAAINLTDNGFGYNAGTWTDIPLRSQFPGPQPGIGAKCTIEVVGGNITNITLTQGGTGYNTGDIFTVWEGDMIESLPDSGDARIQIASLTQTPDGGSGTGSGSTTIKQINYLDSKGTMQIQAINDGRVIWTGQKRNELEDTSSYEPEYGLIDDDGYVTEFSSDRGPEITQSAVNEQQSDANENPALFVALYSYYSMWGLNFYPGKGLQELNQISTFVRRGKLVTKLVSNTPGATCYFPEILWDLYTDTRNGLGLVKPIESLDRESFERSLTFCQANNLFCDTAIVEFTNVREWAFETAGYSLLEYGIIDGKTAIVPAVPTDAAGNIVREVAIANVFNEGNILGGYKEQFLDYKDVKPFQAKIIFRNGEDTFATKTSLIVRQNTAGAELFPEQVFDLSASVTNSAQAILFGKYIVNARRYVTNSVEFQTIPDGNGISPGDYILVYTEMIGWDELTTGTVLEGGLLNSQSLARDYTATKTILIYRSGQAPVTLVNYQITNCAIAPQYANSIFVIGTNTEISRCYKIQEIESNEEGVFTVRATLYPLDAAGLSLIADFSDGNFQIIQSVN